VEINVAWSSGPVNPILFVRSTEPDAVVADASATTMVNPPQSRKRGLLVPLGLGLAGVFADGATGRMVSFAGMAASASGNRSSSPVPVDVTLHVTGRFGGGHLKTLSGDQESIVHSGKRPTTISDKWTLEAG
jgi:hypothetical protein